jgi:hypothetical protein
MARLTKRVVDAAKASSAAVFIWDDEIKGFGLRIATGGTKSYVLPIAPVAAATHRSTASPLAKTARRGRPNRRGGKRGGCSASLRRAMIPRLPARPKPTP